MGDSLSYLDNLLVKPNTQRNLTNLRLSAPSFKNEPVRFTRPESLLKSNYTAKPTLRQYPDTGNSGKFLIIGNLFNMMTAFFSVQNNYSWIWFRNLDTSFQLKIIIIIIVYFDLSQCR